MSRLGSKMDGHHRRRRISDEAIRRKSDLPTSPLPIQVKKSISLLSRCYSTPRTPCADSRPLGAGGKRTIGGRKAPLGATPAYHVQTQGPSVREASTPWAGGRPPRCGRQAHHRRRKAPSGALLPHTMRGLKAPLYGRKAPSGATPAHHVRTQGPSVREASTPGAGGRPRPVLLPHTMCGLKAPRCGRQSLHVRAQGPSVWEACTPYAGGKGPLW
ncbi:hypothetical protein V6N12_009489 [Hibiscus sabdariffa]|uniref:Uncharacterized protein n=1 Tax=Hibiscus sabdariffa TaxID=183260 RepID=A0ABR2E997_9ROSI